ncbi:MULTISPECIES: hypothetical protein [Sphingosinicellaceae]|uniref:hypothetical protein n=1 Tax=Sphingosinicellaceae TaxID=2820280 RepID=UPI001C1E48F9|nr:MULTISPECIES: hypothetical protein [Polymorphobacter]QYE35411.1 hypothetical protein KZX46_05365 [Polymorphobacter sp. PAMC 29334]UAJ11279.1 hypothetical protein KTC28_06150 [Polymorphobacter megasporae]
MHHKRLIAVLCLALPLAVLPAACVTVPQYDATTDSAISAVQREIDGRLVTLISAAESTDPAVRQSASFARNAAFYDQVDSDLVALAMRMEAVQDRSTANLPQFFANLAQQMSNLKAAHKTDDIIPGPVVAITRKQLNANFAVLLTYELSLKGVASAGKASTTSTATATQ